jgi:hypothetical protein
LQPFAERQNKKAQQTHPSHNERPNKHLHPLWPLAEPTLLPRKRERANLRGTERLLVSSWSVRFCIVLKVPADYRR